MSYPDFIEELIIEKKYSALTPNEKLQVSEWIAKEKEYTEIRDLLIELESAVQNQVLEEPSEELRNKLHKVYTEKYKAKKRLLIKWQAVAAITVAASFALILYVGFLFMADNKTPQLAEKQENKKTETVKPEKETPAKNDNKQSQESISTNKVQEQKTFSGRKVEKALPPPPPPALEVVEDDAEEEDELIEDIKVKEPVEVYSSSPEVETTTVKKKLAQRNVAEITSVSPSTVTTKEYELEKDKKYVNITPSVAENIDLLELGVSVF